MTHILIPALAALMFIGLSGSCAVTGDPDQVYGANVNPTGDPIGGGKGYSRIVDRGDITVRSADELLAALKTAEAGQVVFVAAEQIDLDTNLNIRIPEGVTLAGNRGKDGSPGPLLINRKMPQRTTLFNAADNARVTGVRIKGSDRDVPDIDYDLQPRSWCKGISAARNVEVDNCEISNFHHSGVNVMAYGVHIHHNLIHDVHAYPVGLGRRGEALIEANIIHWQWHTIAGTGFPGSSFEARYNLVVRQKPPETWGAGHKSHGFDMHRAYYTTSDKPGHQFYPGAMAGDRILIHHNTMQNTGPALSGLIRGIPRDICRVYNNWFSEPGPELGIKQTEPRANMWVYNNVYGPDKNLVPIGPHTTPQILFKRPEEPGDKLEDVQGKLPLDIEINVLDGLELRGVTVEFGGKQVFSGDRSPRPGEVVIDTTRMPNGERDLVVTAVDSRDVTATRTVRLNVIN